MELRSRFAGKVWAGTPIDIDRIAWSGLLSYKPALSNEAELVRSMKLLIEPDTGLDVFLKELALVVSVRQEQPPELFLNRGLPVPDRHLLLGLAQTVTMAVEERDAQLVAFFDPASLVLHDDGARKDLAGPMVWARSVDGRVAVVAPLDKYLAKRLARQALRWFTGTVRLDIP